MTCEADASGCRLRDQDKVIEVQRGRQSDVNKGGNMGTKTNPVTTDCMINARWFKLSRDGLKRSSLVLRLDFPWSFPNLPETRWQDAPELIAIDSIVDGEDPAVTLAGFEGISLAALLQHGPPGTEKAFVLLSRIAAALDRLHACGLTHGALKPSSILVAEDSSLRIVDWMVGWNSVPMGCLSDGAEYLAPEQIAKDHAGLHADQFALAVIAHELLTGRHPFPGPGLAERLFRIRYGLPEQEFFGETSFAAHAIYERAFSIDPAARFESCASLIQELETVPQRRSHSETRLVDIEDDSVATDTAEEGAEDGSIASTKAGRKPLSRWWAVAGTLVALAFGLGILDWRAQRNVDGLAAETMQVARNNSAGTLENGRFSVCNVSTDAIEIRQLAVAYWGSDHRLNVFNSTVYPHSEWVVPPGSSRLINWSMDGQTVWNGSVLLYFISVREGQKEFIASGRWDSRSQGCLHLS